jgi:cellulose synthase operon protein C
METLVQRLVANPHDQEALAYAHQEGASDPRAYAEMLERVGKATQDPQIASHWLSEAANVWSVALNDAHKAAQILMAAIERDPVAQIAGERLAQLYRDRGEGKSLVALLERRTKALTPFVAQTPELGAQVAAMHVELGQLWSQSLQQPRKGIEHYRRAIEFDAQNVFAIYAARELYKQAQQYAEAIGLFDMEQQLVEDPERKVALYRDEAQVRSEAGDKAGATQVLRNARVYAPEDVTLVVEQASMIVERVKTGEPVPAEEREEAAALFVHLAETYAGEHGLAYSLAALDAMAGHDRAMQLADYFGKELGRTEELPTRWQAYLSANPGGALVNEARQELAQAGAPARTSHVPAATPSPAPRDSDAPRPRQSHPDMGRGRGEEVGDALADLERADAASPEKIAKLLSAASEAASKGNKAGAFAKYKEVLALDPGNTEAVSWVKDHLRQKRLYPDLRDVLTASARAMPSGDEKKQTLRELAGLCEQQLRDVDGAIQALKQLVAVDRGDQAANESLRRLLEKGSRWDELASVLEEEAMGATDQEEKLSLEKKLAQLHETKRKDVVAAAEAWSRIATITPDDDQAVWTAVKLFEKGERADLAAQIISDVAGSIDDVVARGGLLVKLGELREQSGDNAGAGEAFAEAAGATENAKTWEAAERTFEAAERWKEAASAVDARAELLGEPREQAALYARSADLLVKGGDDETAVIRLEQAVELDPTNDAFSESLEKQYEERDRVADLPQLLLRRADSITDREKRVGLRVRAASIQREKLDNMEAARETLLKILEDGDDVGALAILIDDAIDRGEFTEAASLLKRMSSAADTREKKLEARLREATFLAERLEDIDASVSCYESILAELDDRNVEALTALADLEERRENPAAAAKFLERKLEIVQGEEKLDIARRLGDLYEGPLDDERGAIRALEIIVAEDEEDFQAVARLCALTERVEDWERTAALLRKQIEVEGDEEEISRLTRRLAEILYEKLNRGDEALAALAAPADDNDSLCQQAYVELGDKLGWGGIVADRLVLWNESRGPSAERNAALRGAFDRLLAIGRDPDAARVAMELARTRSADGDLATKLEEIGLRSKNLDALQTAHDLLSKDLTGPPRAEELVRQAEVLIKAGVDPLEAIQHGEGGLSSVPAGEVEPLLERLSAIAPTPAHAVDLYERQVSRAKVPADKLKALSRAAQVAAEKGANDRARSFFELALAGGVQEETLSALEDAARSGGEGSKELLHTLADALAGGGQGSRDGGRTRSALLRRAARIAHRDLDSVDRAFGWLGDALVAYVDPASLDALEALGTELGDLPRVEATLTRALGEVFDGPLVKQLLARRALLRRTELGDLQGAATDLKKLHDLAPSDQAVMEDLAQLLTELGDYRGMVQVLEDQILRGKDPAARAELARKVAILWEERLSDAREAADAWRRVLRMKAGDPDAQAGLERAKTNQLRKAPDGPPPSLGKVAAAPARSQPAPARASTPPARPSAQPGPMKASAPPPPPEVTADQAESTPVTPAVEAAPPSARPSAPSAPPSAPPAGRASSGNPPAQQAQGLEDEETNDAVAAAEAIQDLGVTDAHPRAQLPLTDEQPAQTAEEEGAVDEEEIESVDDAELIEEMLDDDE